MKTKKTMSILAISVAGLAVSTASAADTTWTWDGSSSRAWSLKANWTTTDTDAFPDAGDDVVIPNVANDPLLDVDATVNSVDLESDAILAFKTAQTLTVDGGGDLTISGIFNIDKANAVVILQKANALDINGTGTVEISQDADLRLTAASVMAGNPIDGLLKLSASGARFQVQESNTFAGSGSIEGAHDAALIEISNAKVLTNQVDVVGRMQIVGLTGGGDAGKFVNQDVVDANVDGGTLRFMANTLIEDSGTVDADDFKATGGGILQFSVSATGPLKAKFTIEDSSALGSKLLLDTNIDVYTCGTLVFDKGTIDVTGGTFEYVDFSSSTSCSNPADSGDGSSCDQGDRFVVSSDETCS